MVDLADDRDLAVLEALDDVHLPERPRPVQRPTEHVGGELRQLRPAPRGGQGRPAQVVVEVEVGVLDPDRVVQAERHLDQAAPERWQQGQAVLDEGSHPLEAVATGHRGRVEEHDRTDVHVVGRGLTRQERGVEAAQALHRPSPSIASFQQS